MINVSIISTKLNDKVLVTGHETHQNNQLNLLCAAMSFHLTSFANYLKNYANEQEVKIVLKSGYSEFICLKQAQLKNSTLKLVWTLFVNGLSLLQQDYVHDIKLNKYEKI